MSQSAATFEVRWSESCFFALSQVQKQLQHLNIEAEDFEEITKQGSPMFARADDSDIDLVAALPKLLLPAEAKTPTNVVAFKKSLRVISRAICSTSFPKFFTLTSPII
jgi:hypothetical protein